MAVEVKGGMKTGEQAEFPVHFSKKELEFILKKLREGNYKGYEFEIFYSILLKLSNSLTNK